MRNRALFCCAAHAARPVLPSAPLAVISLRFSLSARVARNVADPQSFANRCGRDFWKITAIRLSAVANSKSSKTIFITAAI